MKLKLNEILVYYDFPILFSATDESDNNFICSFVEETTSHIRYICTNISKSELKELENNVIDIRPIFINSDKIFNLLLNSESQEIMEVVETKEDITQFLY
jgi:hypothetical protein